MGGQSIPAFDVYMAPYVRLTFIEEFEKLKDVGELEHGFAYWEDPTQIEIKDYLVVEDTTDILQLVINNTVKRVQQAMESFVHNLNTMHSRGGNQVIFSSINYGTDTSAEGRCVIRELLKATDRGVGNGETAIFPIQIWKLKKGVSAEEGDPNYDLLEYACEVAAKRFFPTFLNLDAPFNQNPLWRPEDPERYKYECATMGCRTRVYENRHGEKSCIGRGNLSFTTINLPLIALESANYAEFLELLEDAVDMAATQLLDRYKFQCSAYKKQFPLIMNGLWLDSETLPSAETPVESVLKHGTLSVGYIGLAECLKVLTGFHHGESIKAQQLGLQIVGEIADRCKWWAEQTDLNFGVIATPAEGLSGKFVKKDREQFGIIEGVTDKEFYTNSNHVPVDYKISIEDKLKIEAPYHALTLAGHISYIEVDGNPQQNVEAIKQCVQLMRKYNVGYGSVNYARARCLSCGYEDGSVKFDSCPRCGSENVDVLARVTGYLVGTTDRWNSGKKAELRRRVSHTTGNRVWEEGNTSDRT